MYLHIFIYFCMFGPQTKNSDSDLCGGGMVYHLNIIGHIFILLVARLDIKFE
jgi:hypothetical protein